jgi:sugar phosphate permease
MGAALSGFLTGLIIDHAGWKYIMLLWAALAVLGIGSLLAMRAGKAEV